LVKAAERLEVATVGVGDSQVELDGRGEFEGDGDMVGLYRRDPSFEAGT
jgi:hypothetical protein